MILAPLLFGATVEGVVTNPEGLPIEGAQVAIYDRRFRLPAQPVITDVDGRYTADVPAGGYRIRVLPPRLTTGSEVWFGDTLRACESPRIAVQEATSIDLQLPPGGAVEGSVFRADRSTLEGEIEVAPLWQSEIGVATRRGSIDPDGHYLITGLPPDLLDTGFLVRVLPTDAPPHYFRSAYFDDEATLVDVPDGGLTELPAFSLRETSVVRGQILGPDGPVENASVVGSNVWSAFAVTDADGRFELTDLPRLPTTIFASGAGLAKTYAGDQGAPVDPVLIADDQAIVEGVVITLPRAGTVRGRVPQLIGDVASGVVLARSDRALVIPFTANEDGVFEFPNLFPGTYTLESWLTDNAGFVAERLTVNGTQEFQVAAGQDLDLGTIELRPAATLVGTVRDDGGNPVGGAAIIIEDLELGRRVAFTEDDGTYALRGIKPGSYDLQAGHGTFCAEDPSFVSVFWPSQINPQVRRQVDLDGGAVFEWDTVMPVDDDSDEMADRWEEEHALDTTADDGDEDPDGDGFTNLAEYRLGTDPNEVYKPEGCGCEQAPSGSWLTGAWLRRRSDRAASGSSSRW